MAFDGKNTLGVLIIVVVALIIGVPLLSSISNSTYENTHIYSVTNESITFANTSNTKSVFETKITDVTYFGNNTVDSSSSLDTLINFTYGGVVRVDGKSISNQSATYNISYMYEPLNYVNSSTSRTLLNLLPFFYALGILAVALMYVFKSELMDMFR
jgi:hypothetical protein